MAKRRTYKPLPERTPRPPETETDRANKWFIRLPRNQRHDIRVQALRYNATLAHAVMDAYRAWVKDAGRPG